MVGRHNLHLHNKLRPVGKTFVHVPLHLEECTTAEVRVCGRQGTSSSDVSGFRRILWATGPHGNLGEN